MLRRLILRWLRLEGVVSCLNGDAWRMKAQDERIAELEQQVAALRGSRAAAGPMRSGWSSQTGVCAHCGRAIHRRLFDGFTHAHSGAYGCNGGVRYPHATLARPVV